MTGTHSPTERERLRRDQVERLYEQARALPPEARAQFVRDACGEDTELRWDLSSLLENAEVAERFFERLAEAVSLPASQEGRTVGHYQILALIGAGGMGAVYRARDTRLNRDVALKFLPAHLSVALDAEERLLIEARAAAALEHPNVCTVHEIGETDDGRPFIAMAFYEGETLKQRLQRGPLSVAEAVDVAAQIARGLAAAHAHGIVHRDVKPGNIIITPQGTVKLLDFGVAKVADVSITRPGSTPGTVAYMSPEQVRGDLTDHRTDLWSLGVVLYEMLTGTRPFRGGNDRVLLQAVLHDDPQPVAQRRPETPERLARIVERLLRKDPAGRYENVVEVLSELPGSPSGDDRPAFPLLERRGPASRGRLRPSWTEQSWKRIGLLGVGLTLFVALGGEMIKRLGPEAPELRRLAVLPLANLTERPQQDYFVAGMHDALVTELSRVGGLTVISRQSTVRYQGSDRPLPVIARELGVDALVEGSVFLAGDSVRITVQLIRAEPEEHIWAGSYHGALRNALTLQGEVATAIARAIQARAAPQVQGRLTPALPVSREAQEAYLKGLYHQERHILEVGLSSADRLKILDSAIAYLREAIALAPQWATAHAKLARAYHWVASSYPDLAAEFFPKSKEAALRALELDESDAQAHASLGFVLFLHQWDWSGAERSIRRALALDPNSHQWIYAMYLVAVGRYEQAIAHYRRAEERNPLSQLVKIQLAGAYSCAGRHDEAVAQLEEARRRWRENLAGIGAFLGNEYLAKSMYAEAIAEAQKAVALSDSAPEFVAMLAHVYARAQRDDAARKLVPWLEKRPGQWYAPELYAALGDTGKAVAMVQAAFKASPSHFMGFRCQPAYAALRAEPEVQEIVRRIGFPN